MRVARSEDLFISSDRKHSGLSQVGFDWGRERELPSCGTPRAHSWAIIRAIGERFQSLLKAEPEIPDVLKAQIEQLHGLEQQPPSR
jgi:hypothetical protein